MNLTIEEQTKLQDMKQSLEEKTGLLIAYQVKSTSRCPINAVFSFIYGNSIVHKEGISKTHKGDWFWNMEGV